MKDTEIVNYGLYIVDDSYFQRFPSGALMQNKGNARPNYFAFRDKDGIYWMLPLSTKVDNYKLKLAKEEKKVGVGNCLYYVFTEINGIERVVLVGNMFPVTSDYVLHPYQINGVNYILRTRTAIRDIEQKAARYLKLIQRGKVRDRAGILGIKRELLKERNG